MLCISLSPSIKPDVENRSLGNQRSPTFLNIEYRKEGGGVFQLPDLEVCHSSPSSAEVKNFTHSYLCHVSELSARKPTSFPLNLTLRIGHSLLIRYPSLFIVLFL
jgi:hypothetical protein